MDSNLVEVYGRMRLIDGCRWAGYVIFGQRHLQARFDFGVYLRDSKHCFIICTPKRNTTYAVLEIPESPGLILGREKALAPLTYAGKSEVVDQILDSYVTMSAYKSYGDEDKSPVYVKTLYEPDNMYIQIILSEILKYV